MKTIIPKYLILFLIFSGSSLYLEAQYRTATDNIAGLDLEEVKQKYEKAIEKGDSSYTIHYAEALVIQSEFERAFDMYEKADELGLVTTKYQKRDYVHAGRRIGKETPYTENTGYFDKSWEMDIDVSSFCSNSPMEDFAPFYWKNLLFITSSRNVSGKQYEFTQNPFLNIHIFIHDCISADMPAALPEGINTENHDGPVAISEDGNLLIITRNHPEMSPDGIYNLYLDYYVRKDNKWRESQKFPLHDTEFSVQHPFYCDRDSLLYFASNVEGGYGGFDIYKSKWHGDQWSEPVNLGPEINSSYDEVFPAQTPDGTLIYASNHLETIGGLDFVLFRDSTRYLFPEPFNTVHDDFSITFKNETSGYFASNRDLQGFNDDIYVFDIIGPLWPEYDFYVEVLDKETEEPLEDVSVSFSAEPAEGEKLSSDEGIVFLHSGQKEFHNYHFMLSKEGYQDKDVVSADFSERDGDYVVTLRMGKIIDPIAEEALERGYFEVYFDNDRPAPGSRNPDTDLDYEQTYHAYMLRKDDYYRNSMNTQQELDDFFADVEKGMEQLEWLAGYLEDEMDQSNSYTIIFTSHASPLASSEYNLILSQRRFVSVENYIQDWDDGALQGFIERGKLDYENNPFGDTQARPGVSSERDDPARSVYSVEAARERRVTIEWRRNDDSETGSSYIRENPDIQKELVPPDQENSFATEEEYHIIIASFRREQDALEEVRQLREQYSANVRVLPLSDNGRYRVSYGNYTSMEDANAALQSIKRNIRNDAWVLVLE